MHIPRLEADIPSIILQGTHCTSGAGLGVVIQTGDDTVFGRIAKMTSKPKTDMTTLQKEIFIFVVYISTLAITLAVICIISESFEQC